MKPRNRIYKLILLAAAVGLIGTGAKGGSQQSAVSPPASPPPRPAPTNIKALPKDISSADLHKLMHEYKEQVGVPCEYCHATNSQTGKPDYASDENPVKETARFMIRMTDDINKKYLAQLGDRRYAPPFNCGTCHQGQPEPPEFKPRQSQP